MKNAYIKSSYKKNLLKICSLSKSFYTVLSDPIHNVTISGNNWIKHGEMLNLNFKCAGSPSPGFFECINLYDDIHNVTDNETCKNAPSKTDQCDVSFQHYYGDQQKHTVVVIIWNDVSRQVARTVVNIYKGSCFLSHVSQTK